MTRTQSCRLRFAIIARPTVTGSIYATVRSGVVYWMLLSASLGCAASPSAPSPSPSPTASPFASIVGDYTLTHRFALAPTTR